MPGRYKPAATPETLAKRVRPGQAIEAVYTNRKSIESDPSDFSDNRHERAQAAILLGQNQDRDSVARLRDLASDPDDLVAIAAMFGAWQLDVDVVTIERMVAALSSDDEELVQESVFALCEMGEAMVPKLTALLDAHTADANAILRVLADIGGDKAFAAISGFKSDNPDIASTIEELLDDWDE